MKHFVQYHHVERMGPASPKLVIHTNKRVEGIAGHVVWLIAGQGQPRKYALAKAFVVDEVGPLVGEDFKHYVRGTTGRTFDPPIALDELPWFPGFLRSQANFSLGLKEIRQDGFIAEFKLLAAANGWQAGV